MNDQDYPDVPRATGATSNPLSVVGAADQAVTKDATLTTKLLARRWHLSFRSIERWRALGLGPRYLRYRGRVLYRLEDVERFEREHLREPGACRR